MVGERFGRLLVTALGPPNKHRKADVVCDCGTTKTVDAQNLKTGATKSCGCLRREVSKARPQPRKPPRHGLSDTPTHVAWQGAKGRCFNINDPKYKDYGGRGIAMCDRWANSFDEFLKDMGVRPDGPYSLERNDVNGNYEPGNCRWATMAEQARNKRSNVVLEFNGERKLATDWAKQFGMRDNDFHHRRAKKGMTVAEIYEEVTKRAS